MDAICALQRSTERSRRSQRNALAGLPGVQSAVLPGSLGMHEECADSVSEVIREFFRNRKCRGVEDCRRLRGSRQIV